MQLTISMHQLHHLVHIYTIVSPTTNHLSVKLNPKNFPPHSSKAQDIKVSSNLMF